MTTPEALLLREEMRGWRFYDQFAPTWTRRRDARRSARARPSCEHDGADLAAAIQTILEIGDAEALARIRADAFPGSAVAVSQTGARFEIEMRQHGPAAPAASAAELSDGTLRYLLWIAALLTPRPPRLLVLNEPETSLHPDLLPGARRGSSHAPPNAPRSSSSRTPAPDHGPGRAKRVPFGPAGKVLGETRIAGAESAEDRPGWHWPAR